MLNRRTMLAAGTALAALPAAAQKKPARGHKGAAEPVPTGTPAATPLGPIDTAARYAAVVDFNTGATLLDKDADVQMPPSSMTKLMTAYIVYGMLKLGRLTLTQELPVSEKAWRMQGSKMFVPFPGSVKVEDLIRGMIIQSGNDACIVLAEAIAGSEEQFVEQMNAKAAELGLTNTHFGTCTGWPDPTQHMSARDIASLSAHIIRDYPQYYHYDRETSFKYNGIEQQNRNSLVQKGIADGLKTGHTDAGGFGLVASADRNGRRVIVVVNGCTSMHQRAEEAERLLEWSYREFENVTLFTGRRHRGTGEGLARQRTDGAPGGRARPGDHHAAAMAQHGQDRGAIRRPHRRPRQPRRHGRQADRQREGRPRHAGAAAGGCRRDARQPAWAGRRRARPLHARNLTALFITLEGGEGAGKSTQAKLLAAWLTERGRDVVLTREPGGSPGAEILRGLLLSGEHDWSADAETLLHFAARAEHAARTIRPALQAGRVVVCDRFYDSTMAYQGYGQGADRVRIATLIAMLGLVPDRTIMLDIAEDEAQRRMAARGLPPDRYDRLGPGFHARVAAGFRAIAAAEPDRCKMIAADGDPASVQSAIRAAIP